MASRRSEGHTLLWAGMGCGGALLALLLLGGGVAALWALGYLGPRRGADAAGARADGKPDTFHVPPPVLPGLPAGNPFANVLPGRKLTVANCEKVKPGMTEAEVRALLGPPVAEVPLFDVRGAGGLAERLAARPDAEPVRPLPGQPLRPRRRGHAWLPAGPVRAARRCGGAGRSGAEPGAV